MLIAGAVKDYDWGIVDGLASWTGVRTGEPQAELWFGVHPGGPSPLVDASGAATGENLGDHFDIAAIPLLVKILAAARPLSVQVHPARDVAQRGWLEQSRSGGAIYSDPFEKTEMLVALEPFDAFAGWRSLGGSAALLDGIPGLERAVAALRDRRPRRRDPAAARMRNRRAGCDAAGCRAARRALVTTRSPPTRRSQRSTQMMPVRC